jgi:hypothetical protein
MRTRKRAAFILVSAAACGVGLLAYAASAAAAVPTCTPANSTGNKSGVGMSVTPNNPHNVFPPGGSTLTARTCTTYQFPGNKPQGGFAKTVTLFFDSDFAINQAAVTNNCLASDVANKNIPDAYAACGPAGKNTYLSPPLTTNTTPTSGKASTAPASNFGACTMVFRGPTTNQVLLYARVFTTPNSNPTCNKANTAGNVTVTLVGTIANAGVAGFGKKLTVPNIDSLTLPLDNFYATVKRGTWFKAKCSATPWQMRGTFAYSGAGQATDTANTTQPCS